MGQPFDFYVILSGRCQVATGQPPPYAAGRSQETNKEILAPISFLINPPMLFSHGLFYNTENVTSLIYIYYQVYTAVELLHTTI